MPITDVHPEVSAVAEDWQTLRDVIEGQRAVKGNPRYRSNIIQLSNAQEDEQRVIAHAKRYLPDFVPPNAARYQRVLNLARFLNITGHTVKKLTGAAFNKEPEVELLPSIEFMEDNADGANGDLIGLAKSCVLNTTGIGRHILLVDFPRVEEQNVSQERQQQLRLQAKICEYIAEAGINWDDDNGILKLLVLTEYIRDTTQDRFSHNVTLHRRIYWLDENRQCRVAVVRDGESINEEEAETVLDFNGTPLDYIPAVIIGADKNGPPVDKSPVLDMAYSNITHYQVDAAHRENLQVHGQLTLGISSDADMQQLKDANGGEFAVGAPNGILLGPGGAFHTATAPESAALPAALEALKEDMVAIGATLVDRNNRNMTARQAGIEATEQTSIMQNVVGNVSDGIELALYYAARFMEASPNQEAIRYRISTEFFDDVVDAQTLTAALMYIDRGILSREKAAELLDKALPIELDENDLSAADEDVVVNS